MKEQPICGAPIALAMRLLALGILGICVAGCNRAGHPTHEVSGKVTLDGTPVAEGLIAFVPEDTTTGARTCEGRIVDGKYSFQVYEGLSRVEISALGIGDPPIMHDGVPLKSNIVPERYNDMTELRAEVTSVKTTFDYELTLEWPTN